MSSEVMETRLCVWEREKDVQNKQNFLLQLNKYGGISVSRACLYQAELHSKLCLLFQVSMDMHFNSPNYLIICLEMFGLWN